MATRKKIGRKRRKLSVKAEFLKWGLLPLNFDMKTGKKLSKPGFITRDGKRTYDGTQRGFLEFVNDINAFRV